MTLAITVLISGRGSNLQALCDAAAQNNFEIRGVVSNEPQAAGLALASARGIETAVVDHRQFSQRTEFEAALAAQLDRWQPELIVLAGFMRVLTGSFVDRYAGRMINIHPSLLPDFRGLNTHERVLQAAVKHHGASVHFVTAELDGGPVIAQTRIDVRADDTAQDLAARLLPLEHRLLIEVVARIAQDRIELQQGKVIADGEIVQQPLLV